MAHSWLHMFEVALVGAIDAPRVALALALEVRGTYLGGRSICTFVVQTSRSSSTNSTNSTNRPKTDIDMLNPWDLGQRSGTGLLGVGCEAPE